MHCNHVIVLGERTRAYTTELLHVAANSENKTQVHTERTNVRAGLAGDPEDTEVALFIELEELGLVDRADTKLALYGRDQRWALEEGTREGLEGAREGGSLRKRIV